ncbi:MAG: hybrid sensor histidine kinase/response regulator [Planctomycetes bacterium]|nr:hybrid sensor histidine kinase/response regulator [Planctomycetota bacterium]
MTHAPNRRVLTVDDTPSIHDDYRKILGAIGEAGTQQKSLAAARAAFFGKDSAPKPAEAGATSFEITSALQGQEALEAVKLAVAEGRPYAVAFVDIRMPPGWDGVKTIQELWKADPALQCVICTAFSDYSWEQTVETLGRSDRLLILKKPFDPVEIRQLATALTEKWNSTAREFEARGEIMAKEAEARSYAASLETANQALRTSKASADRSAEIKRAFLERLTEDVGASLRDILDGLVQSGRTTGLEATLDRSQQLMETVARAEEQGLSFEVSIAPEVPRQIECDGQRLAQVIDQLISNAVRFTEAGGVRISVHAEPSMTWSVARIRVDIEDTGDGIHPRETGSLFEPFAPKVAQKASSGSGLGLAVAKQVARLFGGDLSFDARPGGGTTFHLTFETKRL